MLEKAVRWSRMLWACGLILGAWGCASGAASGPGSASPAAESGAPSDDDPGPRPADAADAVAYYRQHEASLKQPVPKLDPALDFARVRRGWLYAKAPEAPAELSTALGAALEKNDVVAGIEAATKILASEPLNVRVRMLITVLLREAKRDAEAEAHRAVAQGLLQSITSGGDGKSFGTAWIVYQVQEEYGAMDALGYEVEEQSLRQEGDRDFDVLQAKNTETGETIEAYFDITEMFTEHARALSGR
jgi:hypothetical protein